MAAAESLLAEKGVDATTVKAVMARSGVGPGSFYARFEGREALLAHLRDRFWDDIHEGWQAFAEEGPWANAELPVLAGEVVRRLVRGYGQHEGRVRASLVHALRRPASEAMEQAVSLDELMMDRLATLFATHQPDESRVRLALLQVLSTLQLLVLFPDAAPLPARFSEEALILELTRNLLAALGEDGAPDNYRELLRRSSAAYRRG